MIYGTALALESAASVTFWASVTIVSFTAIYTSIGGIRAAIWTDVFQSVVMLAGIMAVLIKGTVETGGSGKVLELGIDPKKAHILDVGGRLYPAVSVSDFYIIRDSAH